MNDTKVDLDRVAATNPAVDPRLVREAQTLVSKLPVVPQGAQYSLRRAFDESRDVPRTPLFRNSTTR